MTSFDEVVIMLHKFDSNSEHTFFTCNSFSAFYSKLYPATSASFWKSTTQIPYRREHRFYLLLKRSLSIVLDEQPICYRVYWVMDPRYWAWPILL